MVGLIGSNEYHELRRSEGYRRAYVEGPARLLAHLERRGDPVRRAVLVGSTSVWHRTDGGEVDERTPPSPRDFRGEAVLAGEQAIVLTSEVAVPPDDLFAERSRVYRTIHDAPGQHLPDGDKDLIFGRWRRHLRTV